MEDIVNYQERGNPGSLTGILRMHERNRNRRQVADIARVFKGYLQGFAEEEARAIAAGTPTDDATIGAALRLREEFRGLDPETQLFLVRSFGQVVLKVINIWGIGKFLNYESWSPFRDNITHIGGIELPQSSLYYHSMNDRDLARAAQRPDNTMYLRFRPSVTVTGVDGLPTTPPTYESFDLDWQQFNNERIDSLRTYNTENSYSTNHTCPDAEYKAARPTVEIDVYNGTNPEEDDCETYTSVQGPQGCLGTGACLLRGRIGGEDGTSAFVNGLIGTLIDNFYANKRSFIGRQPSEGNVWTDKLGNHKLVVVKFNRAFTENDFRR